MIKFENIEVLGWEHAIRGMRNPMNSWDKSDSKIWNNDSYDILGENDLNLMKRLRSAGTDHRKYLRMITVYVDITAPLYWWKEFDTYKIGTVANSCSTMHKIHSKEFTVDDFSTDHMSCRTYSLLESTIKHLNSVREKFIKTKNKDWWWQMIQILPTSYNQKRTVLMNYEVLNNIYKSRKGHKLDEWSKGFMMFIESLPYSEELIVGE